MIRRNPFIPVKLKSNRARCCRHGMVAAASPLDLQMGALATNAVVAAHVPATWKAAVPLSHVPNQVTRNETASAPRQIVTQRSDRSGWQIHHGCHRRHRRLHLLLYTRYLPPSSYISTLVVTVVTVVTTPAPQWFSWSSVARCHQLECSDIARLFRLVVTAWHRPTVFPFPFVTTSADLNAEPAERLKAPSNSVLLGLTPSRFFDMHSILENLRDRHLVAVDDEVAHDSLPRVANVAVALMSLGVRLDLLVGDPPRHALAVQKSGFGPQLIAVAFQLFDLDLPNLNRQDLAILPCHFAEWRGVSLSAQE